MTTFKDNLPRYRRQYAAMRTKRVRSKLITSITDCHGYERKYLLNMSQSTIGRAVRGLRGSSGQKRNKRSGAHLLKSSIPEMPGSQLPEDVPGTCQIDTVALSGGDLRESFFWIATLTDSATQWTGCAPAWNRGGESTARAMRAIHGRLPFAVRHLPRQRRRVHQPPLHPRHAGAHQRRQA